MNSHQIQSFEARDLQSRLGLSTSILDCVKKNWDIKLSLEKIRTISLSKFINIQKDRIRQYAFVYLIGKQGEMGKY